MSKAVRYNQFGDADVLEVVDVPTPTPGPGQVLVKVKAAGINPGEVSIRAGAFAQQWPSTFPSGQGTDLAGVVEQVGDGVTTVSVGDEVIGFTHARSSQAEYVVVEAVDTTPRPAGVSWEAAGALFVAGTTAWAEVRGVEITAGDTVVVTGAAGGVGSVVIQLATNLGATVIGIAGAHNHEWLKSKGVIPIAHGDGVRERIRAAAPDGIDAFIDTFGADYVEIALDLGLQPQQINTIINFPAIKKYGVNGDGNSVGGTAGVLAELAADIAAGRLEIPIAASYPLADVRSAYKELEKRHTRGKIVLVP